MTGKAVPEELRTVVREQAQNRCGYCKTHHFRWNQDGTLIEGRTVCGRATVIALNLNNLVAVTVRRNWVKAGWHPPKER